MNDINNHITAKSSGMKYYILFFFVFVIISMLYGYNKILFYRPMGIHQWRSCVSADFALNYYYNGNFLKPRLNAVLADDRTSDVSIAEFPVIYYFVSILYRIFGYNEFLFRLVNVIIGFLGLLYLYKLSRIILKDEFFALIVPLLIFTSPVYVFYLNNFIPDSTSLSIVFIGFYFFYKFYNYSKYRDLILSMSFFLIAGLIKPSSLLIYLSLLGCYFLELILGLKLKKGEKLFGNPLKHIIPFISVLVVIFIWYYYAKTYSDNHGGSVSPVKLRALWSLNSESIKEVWGSMKQFFKKGAYHSPFFIYIIVLFFLTNIILIKKYHSRLLNMITFLCILGALCFTLMYFRSMKLHDYYQINNLIIIPLISLNFILFLQTSYPKIFKSFILKTVVLMLVILLIIGCRNVMKIRYSDWHHWFSNTHYVVPYGNITPYLRSLGINREDYVYCTPDFSVDISLYLMDQKGYTDFDMPDTTRKEIIELLKPKGLKYIIIGDRKIYEEEDLSPFLNNKIGEFSNVDIYKIIDDE